MTSVYQARSETGDGPFLKAVGELEKAVGAAPPNTVPTAGGKPAQMRISPAGHLWIDLGQVVYDVLVNGPQTYVPVALRSELRSDLLPEDRKR